VQVTFVTVDPERDDPQRMKTYLAALDPASSAPPAGPRRWRRRLGSPEAQALREAVLRELGL